MGGRLLALMFVVSVRDRDGLLAEVAIPNDLGTVDFGHNFVEWSLE